MKLFNLISAGLLMHVFAYASPKPVKVGDICPNLELTKIINFKVSSAHINDFKGKKLIIDFWQTYCTPCIASFPKIDSLQKKFTDQLVILPVTTDKENTVSLLFSKMLLVKHVKACSVVDDSLLSLAFPHNIVPHYVWIDENGIVKKITGGEEFTYDSIVEFLSNNNRNTLRKRIDPEYKLPEFVIANPLMSDVNKIERIDSSKILCQSVLSNHVDGIWGSVNVDTNSITLANVSIQWLYQIAFMKYGMGASNRIVINTNDSLLYRSITPNTNTTILSGTLYDLWASKNTYCYNLRVPLPLAEKKFDIMLEELNRNFGLMKGIKGTVENKKTKCWILKRTSTQDLIGTKGGKEEVVDNRYFLHLKNASFNWIMLKLAGFYMQLSAEPILDEAGYDGKVDIDIDADLSDLSAVNDQLKKYDLQFVEADRNIKMMVISRISE